MIRSAYNKFMDKITTSVDQIEAISLRDDVPTEETWSAIYNIVEDMENTCERYMQQIIQYSGFKARNKNSLVEMD